MRSLFFVKLNSKKINLLSSATVEMSFEMLFNVLLEKELKYLLMSVLERVS